MRKLLFTVAACVLCAAPLKAQSSASLAPEPQAAAEAVAPEPRSAPKPSLYPTTDEVRHVAAHARLAPLGHLAAWWRAHDAAG